MGQKVNPIVMRLSVNKDWSSKWYAKGTEFANLLHEDLKIRKYITKELKTAAISKVVIERPAKKAIITIHTARPGVVIGKKGTDIEKIKSKNKSSIDRFVNSLKLFGYGYSWGGFESLALQQEIRKQGKRKYLNLSKDEHIVRLHIGLEDPKDLTNDLKSSLKFIK